MEKIKPNEEPTFLNLNENQVKKISRIIDVENEKSKKFGLDIDEELLTKEKNFFLKTVDELGGVDGMFRDREYEEVRRTMGGKMFEYFSPELRSFFKKLNETGKINNMYNCHLESVLNMIALSAKNGLIPHD